MFRFIDVYLEGSPEMRTIALCNPGLDKYA